MLENPRNKEFDVYVLDEVFPENEHSEFLKLIRELNGDWKKRIDDLEEKLQSQAEEVEKQRKQIDGWIKRHLLDPNGKMM